MRCAVRDHDQLWYVGLFASRLLLTPWNGMFPHVQLPLWTCNCDLSTSESVCSVSTGCQRGDLRPRLYWTLLNAQSYLLKYATSECYFYQRRTYFTRNIIVESN